MPGSVSPGAPPIVAQGRLLAFRTDSATGPREIDYRFALPVLIHGQTLELAADLGATGSTLTDAAIDRIRIPHWYSAATRVDTLPWRNGVAPPRDSTASVTITHSDTTFQYFGDFEPSVVLDSLRAGTAREDSVVFAYESPAETMRPFDGLIGRDILSAFDLVFDLPARSLQLYARSNPPRPDARPSWLPRGVTAEDCVAAKVVRHMGMDSTLDDDERKQIATAPFKRMWNQEELQLPLLVNGHRLDGLFDSGNDMTIINWAEANALGITRASPSVRPYSSGSLIAFSFNAQPKPATADSAATRYRDSTFIVAGVALQIGRQRLPADSVYISDPSFSDFPGYTTKPLINVGWWPFRDRVVYFSYSTRHICVSGSRRTRNN